jgi:hypothetical protein
MAHLLLYFRDKYTPKKTYDLIKEAKQKDYIITAGIFKDLDGLKHVNVYTIIDVFKMKDEKNKVFDTQKNENRALENYFVTMRNPWANETYTGPWSKNDSKWSAEMKK